MSIYDEAIIKLFENDEKGKPEQKLRKYLWFILFIKRCENIEKIAYLYEHLRDDGIMNNQYIHSITFLKEEVKKINNDLEKELEGLK